jgi:hypothetical protein
MRPMTLEGTVDQGSHAEASEPQGNAQPGAPVPQEWDGGPLRPNLARQIRLGSGLR